MAHLADRRPGACWVVFATTIVACMLCKLLVLGSFLDTTAHPTQRAAATATAAMLLVLVAPLALLSWPRRIAALLALDGAVTLVGLADLVHFRFLGDVLSLAEVPHAAQLASVISSVAALLRARDALWFADVFAGAAIWAVFARRWTARSQPHGSGALAVAVLTGLALLLGSVPLRLIWLDPEDVFAYATTRREVAVAIGLLPYHVYDVTLHTAYPLRGRLRIDDAKRKRVRDLLERRRLEHRRSSLHGVARGANVILVMAESLERFPIGLSVRGQPITPHLTRFAGESLDFTNFFDQTHDGTTADGEFTSLQGLHPLPVGVVATRFGSNDFYGLPAILAAEGYRTLSAAAENGDFWNKRQMHPRLGFARSYFADRFGPGEVLGMGLSDDDFFRQTLDILRSGPEPFMAFMISLSNHHPYRVPAQHRVLELGALEDTLLGDYLHSVHHFDRAFGRFVDALRRGGVLDRSLVAVYGDHQAFWEEIAELPALLGFDASDAHRRWEAREKLPFLIRLPFAKAAGEYPRPGGHLDVTPTVLALLGVDEDGAVGLGRDLTSDERPFVAFRNGDFIAGGCACIRETSAADDRCHDLETKRAARCFPIEEGRREARERLDASDAIVNGNLIPELRAAHPSRLSAEEPDRRPRLMVIAHRGDSTDFPENTIAAIEGGFALGCELVEVDVRLSRDGVPIVMHDERVDRTTNGKGLVADLTLAELKALDAGSWKDSRFENERVPTLAEALQAANGKGKLLLDVAVGGMGAAVAEVVRSLGMSPRDVIVGTWDAVQRADFAARVPGATILLSEGAPERWDDEYFAAQKAQGVSVFEIPNWSTEFIRAAHSHGMPVWVYTVNDEATMRRLIAAGADAIETDVPRLAIRLGRELEVRH